MQKENNFKYSGKGGHVMIPRSLLYQVLCTHQGSMSEALAFLCMLTNMNYMDRKTRKGEVAERGTASLPIKQWSDLFGWEETKTRRFFRKLESQGVIEILKNSNPHRIRLTQYELLCAGKKQKEINGEQGTPMSETDRKFEEFWEKYHEVTQQMPVEKYAASREWKRMNIRERHMAMENIEDYFMSLPSISHVRKAINYLRDKSFLSIEN